MEKAKLKNEEMQRVYYSRKQRKRNDKRDNTNPRSPPTGFFPKRETNVKLLPVPSSKLVAKFVHFQDL